MRTALLNVLIVLVLAIASYASDPAFAQPSIGGSGFAFGYSSDEADGVSYLGVDTRNVTADRLSALNLKEERGVEITMVDQDAPAGKAGLKERDVILTMNGSEVESVEALRRMIRETPPGRSVTLGISRNGQPMTIKVQLASRKQAFAFSFPKNAKAFNFVMPPMPAMADMDIPVSVVVVHSAMRSGLMVENLTAQLGDFFGVKDGHGVLVRSVEKGSRAEKSGFRAGDVIVKVDEDSVSDTSDFSHALRSHKNTSVNVGIVRDKREQTLTLSLPPRDQSHYMDESWTAPELDSEVQIDLTKLDEMMAQMRPQIELAVRQSQKQLQELNRSMSQQREGMRRQQQEMRKQMLDQQRQMRDQIRKELHRLSEI